MNIEDMRNKKIALLGFGVENQALLKWLTDHKVMKITICDRNPKFQILNPKQIPNPKSQNLKISYQLGKKYLDNLSKFDIIFRSPGIPYLLPEIQKAKKLGTIISSQIKLFFDLTPAKIIGVTGTKGKGTTTSLIYEILKTIDYRLSTNVYLGGNIGNAPIEFLDKIKSSDRVVLELSSFQLQDLDKSPHIAIVLNITTDHLDYHKDQKEYIDSKLNIVRHQLKSDSVVVNLDYLTSFKFAVVSPAENKYYFSHKKSVDLGCFIDWDNSDSGRLILRTEKKDYLLCSISELKIKGAHNLENVCAAAAGAYLAGVRPNNIKKIIIGFKGLPLRIEFIRKIKGISFFNDSASTNPDTAIAAIKSFNEPIILIAGGSSKNADYKKLGKVIENSSVKAVVSIGQTGPKIVAAIKDKRFIKTIKNCKNMAEAVRAAYKLANSSDIVLLSPASASFDWFKDYKDRGQQFNLAVKNL
ncbi:MAG: UDP-N-acetylmuramoyl-L-alanine--D-glutamate ligase [Patescibacteria group bacterium]|nr:UDP-N-acetylmuramoyl-L-alanine--D-glutamate ligase [Patescibacteria group bacterium]